jgi:hypothetical protein
MPWLEVLENVTLIPWTGPSQAADGLAVGTED